MRQILNLYRRVYEDLLAVPVICGIKSEKEKFAGGLYTTTTEAFIPTTGRAIQGATSHCLGQNFAEMFNIVFEDEKGGKSMVWQNSWGLTTRTIGVMVMVHGDDKGLVLPPRVASIQAIVIACGITVRTTPEEKAVIEKSANDLVDSLVAAGIRAKGDLRDNYTPGYKFNHWELKGVPLRLEVGPTDMAKNQVRCVRRVDGIKTQLSRIDIGKTVRDYLDVTQADMLARAQKARDERLVHLTSFDGFVKALDQKCLVLAPWCETVKCEEEVKERSSRQYVPPILLH